MSKSPLTVWTLRLTLVGALVALLGSACVDVKVDVDRDGQKRRSDNGDVYADEDEDEEGYHAFDARAGVDTDDDDDDDDDDGGGPVIHEHTDLEPIIHDHGDDDLERGSDYEYDDGGVHVEVNVGDEDD